ncbi:amidohydrolase [Desmospora profundinema]|nr:amidohydrolase [Desmospora profundinema]
MKEREPLLTDAAMLVDGDRIAWVGNGLPPKQEWDELVDMKDRLLLPGWVNTHNHAAMTLLRGYADDLPLQIWLEKHMWPMEARFQAQQVQAGTRLAVLEMIRGGTTCFADMYDHMDEVAQVVADSGIRARLCRGVIGLGSEVERRSKLEEAVQFVRDWDGGADGRITTMLGPHAPYTCPPDYIRQIVEQAESLDQPIHTHLSETMAEVEQNVNDYGVRPVEHLDRLGVFRRPTLVAHAVHVNDEEIALLADRGVKISHNPGSNLKLGSGIAPISLMFRYGLKPALGTDGAASNNNLDLLGEIQLAALIHKGAEQNPEAVPAIQALAMGTRFGAEALFLEKEIGTLEPGKKADFISVDLTGPHMQPAHDLVSHLVYAASSADVQDVYVDGRPLMRNRQLLTLDEEKIRWEAQQAFHAIAPEKNLPDDGR